MKKYYVSGKIANLDVGSEIEDCFGLDGLEITEVDEVQ